MQRKRRDFKKGVRGLAPPIVLGGQPSALLALLTAGNRCNPYLDTVGNGSALGNPASTTHSLTPSPSNRPLIFWILTPRKKPEATGSAGRCEPGVGRFTDPHPLTCSFFTPSLRCFMFGLCEWPLRALLGLLFPFLPFICPPVLSPAWMGWFSLIQVRRCHGFVHSCPTRPNRVCLGLRWCCFLTRPPKTHTGPHRGEFGFSPPKQVYPSP